MNRIPPDPVGSHVEVGGRAWDGTEGGSRCSEASERLARVVFALLVLGCIAAFVVTQRLKHAPTPVEEFKLTDSFSPQSGSRKLEALSFKLSQADVVTVTIVGSTGRYVATLVSDLPVAREGRLSLRWNGREGIARGYSVLTSSHAYEALLPANTGGPAAAGEYQARVRLRVAKRTVPSPREFMLVRP